MANFIEELRADEYLHNSSTVLELVNNPQLVNNCDLFFRQTKLYLGGFERTLKKQSTRTILLVSV